MSKAEEIEAFETENTESDLVCPFCGQEDFDKIGLKYHLRNHAKAIMLWYALKMFTTSVYEQITETKFPEHLLPNH